MNLRILNSYGKIHKKKSNKMLEEYIRIFNLKERVSKMNANTVIIKVLKKINKDIVFISNIVIYSREKTNLLLF